MEANSRNAISSADVPESRSAPVVAASLPGRSPIPQPVRSLPNVMHDPTTRAFYAPGAPSGFLQNTPIPTDPPHGLFRLSSSTKPAGLIGDKGTALGKRLSGMNLFQGGFSHLNPSPPASGSNLSVGAVGGPGLSVPGPPSALMARMGGKPATSTTKLFSSGGGTAESGTYFSMAQGGDPPQQAAVSGSSSTTRMSYEKVPNRENVIALWISDITDPAKKMNALKKLSDAVRVNDDLPIADWLWHAFGVVTSLLGDITSRFPMIVDPEKLTDEDALAICYALDMFTVMVRSPVTMSKFVDCQFAAYFIPLLKLRYGLASLRDAIVEKVLVILRTLVEKMGLPGASHLADLGAWALVYRVYFETTLDSQPNVDARVLLDRLSIVLGVGLAKKAGEFCVPATVPSPFSVSYGGPNAYAMYAAQLNAQATQMAETSGKPKPESNTRTAA